MLRSVAEINKALADLIIVIVLLFQTQLQEPIRRKPFDTTMLPFATGGCESRIIAIGS
jgi:hypothetical protein